MRCTKIAAKLVRTFTERHGLRDLCRELLGVEISKQQQTSDWGAVGADLRAAEPTLPPTCCTCTRCGPSWRHCWCREGRLELAEACFAFLPARTRLDALGYEVPDIFSH